MVACSNPVFAGNRGFEAVDFSAFAGDGGYRAPYLVRVTETTAAIVQLRGKRVLVAVSGGPDSTALLIALHEAGNDIVAAHYDHALRKGSDAVARQVGELCGTRCIPYISERRDGPLPKGSLQAAARDLRYAFLERARLESGAEVVAVAHTADDVVEGAVLHLQRGCGLAGMRGMPDRRGHYVRPWLDVWRTEVADFLRERGVEAFEDPANRDLHFARVRLRLHILPALERDRPGILRRIHAAARAASTLYETASAQARAAVDGGPVTAPQLRALPEAVAVEVIKLIYAAAGGREPGLSRSQLAAMRRLAADEKGGRGVDLPGSLRFRIVGGLLEIIPRHGGREVEPRLLVKECAGCDERDVAHLRGGLDLQLGHRSPGVRMRPAGGRGTRKLQDIFVDARVPREERDAWPLVFAAGRLAWVPGVAVDADHASRPGEPAVHVSVTPFPAKFTAKVVRLETPHRPAGDQI